MAPQLAPGRSATTDLQRSHKEIRRLNFGKRDTPLLRILRRTLRESREVAKREGLSMRVKIDLSPPKKWDRMQSYGSPCQIEVDAVFCGPDGSYYPLSRVARKGANS